MCELKTETLKAAQMDAMASIPGRGVVDLARKVNKKSMPWQLMMNAAASLC